MRQIDNRFYEYVLTRLHVIKEDLKCYPSTPAFYYTNQLIGAFENIDAIIMSEDNDRMIDGGCKSENKEK